jgi:hypothetical protein
MYDNIVRLYVNKQLERHLLTINVVLPKGTSKTARYEPKSYSFSPASNVTLPELEIIVRKLNFSVFGKPCKSIHLTI